MNLILKASRISPVLLYRSKIPALKKIRLATIIKSVLRGTLSTRSPKRGWSSGSISLGALLPAFVANTAFLLAQNNQMLGEENRTRTPFFRQHFWDCGTLCACREWRPTGPLWSWSETFWNCSMLEGLDARRARAIHEAFPNKPIGKRKCVSTHQ